MKRIIVLIGMVFVFLACTRDFKEINTDKSGVTDEDLQADYNEHGIRLGIIQQGIYFNYDYGKGKNWPFQLTQNLNADMFSGYMHDAKPLNGGSHNSDYNLQDGWNSAMWGHTYEYVSRRYISRRMPHVTVCLPFRHYQDTEGGSDAPCHGLLRPYCV